MLSDMCHSTIGNAAADAARSLSLGETAASLSLGSEFNLDGVTWTFNKCSIKPINLQTRVRKFQKEFKWNQYHNTL